MTDTVDFTQHLASRPDGEARGRGFYRFLNGHFAIVDLDPQRPFRFEVCSSDPETDDGTRTLAGKTVAGLTSEQVEAKLTRIAALPQQEAN